MGLTIDDDHMTSDLSLHTARLVSDQPGTWEVSWLPGSRLNRNSAITAMILADVISDRDVRPDQRDWIFIEGWAAELGLTAPEAIAQINPPQSQRAAETVAEPPDPEAAG